MKNTLKSNFRKISLKHIIEISTARIDEIVNILFNKNKNLEHYGNKKLSIPRSLR